MVPLLSGRHTRISVHGHLLHDAVGDTPTLLPKGQTRTIPKGMMAVVHQCKSDTDHTPFYTKQGAGYIHFGPFLVDAQQDVVVHGPALMTPPKRSQFSTIHGGFCRGFNRLVNWANVGVIVFLAIALTAQGYFSTGPEALSPPTLAMLWVGFSAVSTAAIWAVKRLFARTTTEDTLALPREVVRLQATDGRHHYVYKDTQTAT